MTGSDYAPVFNPGWMKQLVFHSDKNVASVINAELLAKTAHRRRLEQGQSREFP